MFKKLLISVTSALVISVGNFSNAYDYQELSKAEQESVKQQETLYSLGVATSKNEIEIYKHCEEGNNLKETYNINIHNGNLKKGNSYIIKYYGDYISDIKKL